MAWADNALFFSLLNSPSTYSYQLHCLQTMTPCCQLNPASSTISQKPMQPEIVARNCRQIRYVVASGYNQPAEIVFNTDGTKALTLYSQIRPCRCQNLSMQR